MPAAESDAYVRRHPRATGYHLSRVDGADRPGVRPPDQVSGRRHGERRRRRAAARVLPQPPVRLVRRVAALRQLRRRGGRRARKSSGRCSTARSRRCAPAGGTHLELRHTSQRFCAPDAEAAQGGDGAAARRDVPSRNGNAWTGRSATRCGRARRAALTVSIGGAELADEFYEVFAQNMRDLGTPVYTRDLFDEVLTTFPQTSRAFVVRHQGQPVAGSVVVWHQGAAEVPWASALRSANALSANVFLYWQMLKFCVEQGLRRSTSADRRRTKGRFISRSSGAPRRASWCGNTGPRQARAVPDMSPKNPEVRSRGHGPGSGCRYRWRRSSARTSFATFPVRACSTFSSGRLAVLAYVLVGYPVLLQLLVKLRGASARPAGGHHAPT